MIAAGLVRRGVTWLVLAGALAAGLLFVVLHVALPSDGARAAFYGGAWSDTGVLIDPIDEPAAGLERGDTIVSIAGVSMETWVRAAADPTRPRPDAASPIEYDLLRASQPVTIAVTWARPAVAVSLLQGWGVLLFSIVTVLVTVFVFRRRPDEPAATALVLLAAGASGSSVPWFLGVTTSDVVSGLPFLVHSLVTGPLYMLLWPAAIHLALVFPGGSSAVPRRRWLVPAVYGGALGAYAALMLAAAASASSALAYVGTWPGIQVLVVVPCLATTLVLMGATYLRSDDPRARARIRLATAGAVISAGLGLALFMLPVLLTGYALVPDAVLGLIALPLPLGIAAGILHDRLFDIDAALNRTLVYGGLTLGVLVTYVVAAAGLGALVGTEHGLAISLLATALAALGALPLRDRLQRAVNRLMYGQRHEPLVAMRRLAQRLAWAADPEGAVPAIVDTVRDALRVPYVAVEVDRNGGGPVVASEFGRRPADVIAVPLVHGAEPVGRLLLGRRSGEHDFHPDESRLLDDLARQAGTAIAALALRDDLARSRERLVLAREEERRRLRRDLHDGLGPALAAIGMRAEAAAALVHTDPTLAESNLDALGAEARAALADVRRLVDGLRPPALDELGLVGAIRQQAGRLESSGPSTGSAAGSSAGLRITVDGPSAESMPELPAAVEVAAYRIAIEALTNTVRHAAAATCQVRIQAAERLEIEVVDDGVGLPAEVQPGVGLESMRVRAAEVGGEIRVEAHRPQGTRVLALLPMGGVVAGDTAA